MGRKSHQDAFAATRRPPAEKIYTRTYFNKQRNNAEYKRRLRLFCTFIGVLLRECCATRRRSHSAPPRPSVDPASPLPFIPIVRFTCLPMVLLPSNTAADLNSYDRENIFVRNTFPRMLAVRPPPFVWDTIARVCIFIYLFSWGEYECSLCLDNAKVNINIASVLSSMVHNFVSWRWI